MTYLERTIKALKERIAFIDKQTPDDTYTKRMNKYRRDTFLCAIGTIELGRISEDELERAAVMHYSLDMLSDGKGFQRHAKWLQERYLVDAAAILAASKGLT
jgi:hypothetical protein